MVTQNMQFEQETRTSIQSLQTHMDLLATEINNLASEVSSDPITDREVLLEVEGKEEFVGDDKVRFNSFDIMHHSVNDEINYVHDDLLIEPLHDDRNECEFSCSYCTDKNEICNACNEIAEFLRKEHVDDAVDLDVAHDLSAICSEISMSLINPVRCDRVVFEDSLQVTGPPPIQQQSLPILECVFDLMRIVENFLTSPSPCPCRN